MEHPTAPGSKWLCPVTDKPYKQTWSNHDKPGIYNECVNCAPENAMSVGKRLAELAKNRQQHSWRIK